MPRVGLQFVIVVFPDYAHLLFKVGFQEAHKGLEVHIYTDFEHDNPAMRVIILV